MEKGITDKQWQLTELLETRDFIALTVSEQRLVLQEMTEFEYAQKRKVILESADWINEIEPLPLVIPEKKRGLMVPIPLYQSIAAAAAVFLLSFFIFKSNGNVVDKTILPELASVDTVYIEKHVRDTIIEYDTKYVDRVIVQNTPEQKNELISTNTTDVPSRENLPNRSITVLPDLSELKLDNNGKSANDDETFGLLEGYSLER